ncbi:MAG: sporulation histidine kinase inhibitor Sda [Bacillota bacterium]
MKIMSNEQLVAAYRDAEKTGTDRDWIQMLKKEIHSRGIRPVRKI